MSKSLGQTLGGVLGGVIGFIGAGPVGAVKGFLYGTTLGGMIDPPPGPDLKGPTLEDRGFNSAAYGVSLATLHGTIAHTGSIIYLENNEYKAVAKKQKTGGKGGGSKGSYTTTTYFATFAAAIGEAMPGSSIRRIWLGGKLFYSVGDVDSGTYQQSTKNSTVWKYYDGSQIEPDSRMEAVLGVGNCPSYEGTAYIIFYDLDLTEFGNGLQGCPVKVEVGYGEEDIVYATETNILVSNAIPGAAEGFFIEADPGEKIIVSLDFDAGVENAWSPYGLPNYHPDLPYGCVSTVNVEYDDDSSTDHEIGSNTLTDGYALAAAGFGEHEYTGHSKYRFYIFDDPYEDNSGSMAIKVERIAKKVNRVGVDLADLCAKYFERAGIASEFYDFSELEGVVVEGYRNTDPSSARGSLGPLQVAYLFDLIEDGYTIKAVKRGGSSIATIPLSKCGARAAGESPGVRVQRDRETESQLPSRYLLTYIDYNREYDTNTQPADYPSRANNEVNRSLPVVLSATNAAKLADVLINLAWVERFNYEFTLPQEFAYLKPSNVITVEVSEGNFVVVRISSITYTADQRVQVSARRAEPTVYQSGAVGIDVVPPSENIPLITSAKTLIMDLPAITDDVTGYGFGVAMHGGESWPGGNLLRSIDTGQTYDAIQAFTDNCTLAAATDYLPAGDYFVIDRTTELNINVIAGEFFSITEAQMLTGKHYCAYGVGGRWEIIQYAVASVVSGSAIKLSTFVRGLFGTEWAGDLHEAGDLVVLLDDPDTAFIGADAVALNSPRKFKGVTTGQDAQLAPEIDFTYRGTNLKPLSPVAINGYIASEVWYLSWSDRTRFSSSQWLSGQPAPIGEAQLQFEIDIYDGATFKKTYATNTADFEYSAAQQIADFGYLVTTLKVIIYKISATVGRGYGAEITLYGVADEYVDYNVLHLHFNGADNSTTFTDSSKYARVPTVAGNAKIQTADFKFGGAAGIVDGTGDYLQYAHDALFNVVGDAQFECWIKPTVVNVLKTIASKRPTTGAITGWSFVVDATAKLGIVVWGAADAVVVNLSSSVSLVAGTRYHVAFSHIGTTWRLFVNGVKVGEVTQSGLPIGNTSPLYLFRDATNSARDFNGIIDELRFKSGVGLYDSDFAEPTAPFTEV